MASRNGWRSEENERLVQQLGTAIAAKAVMEQERDDALSKLANARKVIRDLLGEQKVGFFMSIIITSSPGLLCCHTACRCHPGRYS